MIAITIYLMTIPFVGLVIGLMAVEQEKIVLEDKADVILSIGMMTLWPIVLLSIPVALLWESVEKRLRDKAHRVINSYNIGSDKNDRSWVVQVPEKDLKILLKAHRKEIIKLVPNQIEIIRDELMNRLTEKALLK